MGPIPSLRSSTMMSTRVLGLKLALGNSAFTSRTGLHLLLVT